MLRFVLLMMLSTGIASSQTWVLKLFSNSTTLGNAVASNPLNPDVVYSVPGNTQVYVSRNRGYTWLPLGNAVPWVGVDLNIIKSIAVNPLDTLQLLLGIETSGAVPDRIVKSTNGGVSWTQTWGGTFSYYGKPVEFKPVHPDTVYTMGNDTLWRSTNFGSTWDTVSVQRDAGHFNAWCDAEIRPDSANIMFIGDATSGIWKTYDHGSHWKKVYSIAFNGEIPSIAIDPFNPRVAYASRFSGGGGLLKSTDWGETWQSITTPIGSSPSWWVVCSPVHHGFVYFGVYSVTPGGIFISRDSGATWENFIAGLSSQGKFNYGLLVEDSLTVIASQANGVHKLEYPVSIHLNSPNGGQIYVPGVHHPITWTTSNLYAVKVQYSLNNGSTWTTLADSVPSSQTSYDWIIPPASSSQCRVRVIDRRFTTTADTSDSAFSIVPFALTAPNGGEQWTAGAHHTISWAAVDFPYVNLYYSLDSGATWQYITRRPSTSGSFSWLVPDTSSSLCKIKVSNGDDSTMFHVSADVFSIEYVESFGATLAMKDAGNVRDTVYFGAAGGATDSIDPAFGEIVLPSKPPYGTFDIRWNIPSTNGTMVDYRDSLSAGHQSNIYVVEFQPGPAGYPCTFSWTPESLKAGMYILRDTLTHGNILRVDMRTASTVIVTDAVVTALEIVECKTMTVTYGESAGWTLMSLPVQVFDRKKTSLFPYSASAAFAYSGGYVAKDTLEYGVGYWLKLEQSAVSGCSRLADTIGVKTGWNMIGSISSPVAVSSIVTVPESILVSNFFGYHSGYTIASTIDPGGGYWVRANNVGTLILTSSGIVAKQAHKKPERKFHTLTVSDGEGSSSTLYFGVESEGVSPEYYQMPPIPPAPAFDVRFASGRMAEMHPKILKNDADYPFYVISSGNKTIFSWGVENEENFTYILIEKQGGKEIAETRLTGHGELLIKHGDQSTFTLKVTSVVGSAEYPKTFSLSECFPNPFNPTTHFNFTLPSDAYVNITIYSLLGEEVQTLVTSLQSAGLHDVIWNGEGKNGTPRASGIYMVKMSARSFIPDTKGNGSEFTAIRKIVLLK